MEQDLSNYRKSYEKRELLEKDVDANNPMTLFQKWFDEADNDASVNEANAMTLATIGLDGFPKSRVVLLKKIKDGYFIFFTNYGSEKGRALQETPKACISFFWESSERQIIVKGDISKLSDSENDEYFQSRPRGSRLGAIASHQSEIIESREVLENRLETLDKKYGDKHIPRPNYWGGFKLSPVEYEFWQGRPNRLHDRLRYRASKSGVWQLNRLSP
ncbi:MAG: pyridoxamine 5'-phosphate oxidase [Bacteroidota bacterium]